MARRSDHSPVELQALLLDAGHELMVERGLANFSAREAARRASYTVGTIYHVFGSLGAYILAINTCTLTCWANELEVDLDRRRPPDDRIGALVRGYFRFAEANRNAWMAIYEFRRPPGLVLDPDGITARAQLTAIVDREVAGALHRQIDSDTRRLARSLIATVHGHAVMHLTGNFELMSELDPAGQAVSRVHESILCNVAASR